MLLSEVVKTQISRTSVLLCWIAKAWGGWTRKHSTVERCLLEVLEAGWVCDSSGPRALFQLQCLCSWSDGHLENLAEGRCCNAAGRKSPLLQEQEMLHPARAVLQHKTFLLSYIHLPRDGGANLASIPAVSNSQLGTGFPCAFPLLGLQENLPRCSFVLLAAAAADSSLLLWYLPSGHCRALERGGQKILGCFYLFI